MRGEGVPDLLAVHLENMVGQLLILYLSVLVCGLSQWLSDRDLPAMQETWVRKIPWRRKWQLTPVFLPGKSHGWRRLADYSPWGHKELDMTEQLSTHTVYYIF